MYVDICSSRFYSEEELFSKEDHKSLEAIIEEFSNTVRIPIWRLEPTLSKQGFVTIVKLAYESGKQAEKRRRRLLAK